MGTAASRHPGPGPTGRGLLCSPPGPPRSSVLGAAVGARALTQGARRSPGLWGPVPAGSWGASKAGSGTWGRDWAHAGGGDNLVGGGVEANTRAGPAARAFQEPPAAAASCLALTPLAGLPSPWARGRRGKRGGTGHRPVWLGISCFSAQSPTPAPRDAGAGSRSQPRAARVWTQAAPSRLWASELPAPTPNQDRSRPLCPGAWLRFPFPLPFPSPLCWGLAGDSGATHPPPPAPPPTGFPRARTRPFPAPWETPTSSLPPTRNLAPSVALPYPRTPSPPPPPPPRTHCHVPILPSPPSSRGHCLAGGASPAAQLSLLGQDGDSAPVGLRGLLGIPFGKKATRSFMPGRLGDPTGCPFLSGSLGAALPGLPGALFAPPFRGPRPAGHAQASAPGPQDAGPHAPGWRQQAARPTVGPAGSLQGQPCPLSRPVFPPPTHGAVTRAAQPLPPLQILPGGSAARAPAPCCPMRP